MKTKIFTLLFLLTGLLKLQAQVSVSIQILPPYPNKITDYSSRPQLMVVSVMNPSNQSQRIQLRGTVIGDNGIVLRVRDSYKSPTAIVLGAGESLSLNGNDISKFFDYTKIDYTGITQNEFINKNGLPEGSYRFCIRAYDYDSNQPISGDEPVGCSNTFTISSLEPPQIIMPAADAEITSAGGQNFPIIWNTPPSTAPGIRYKIRIVEIMGNKNANDAMMTATQPYFFETEVGGNAYTYQPNDPALTPGRRYALSVQAFDPFNNTPFRNKGISEVRAFTYTKNETQTASRGVQEQQQQTNTVVAAEPDCGTCKVSAGAGKSLNTGIVKDTEIKVGQFSMKVVTAEAQANGLLRGTGTIALPFINSGLPGARLRVTFQNLDVNETRVMKSGTVEGVVNNEIATMVPKANGPSMKTVDLTEAQTGTLADFFTSHANYLMSSVKSSADAAGFELPLGIDKGPITIAVARVYFTATQAWFDAVSAMDLPDGFSTVALSGRGICLNKDNLCGTGTLYLAKDFQVPALGMLLKKPGANLQNDPGTSVSFTQLGFEKLNITAEYTFPGNALMGVASKLPLVAKLQASTTEGWSNWMATLTVPEFYVFGMPAIKFNVGADNIYYDHSDKVNPPGIPNQFTSSDPNETPISTVLKTWTGFYIPKVSVTLPEILTGGNSNSLKIEGIQLIYEQNNGFTGTIRKAGEILKIGQGSMGGWYASIDEVNLEFFRSAFKTSKMTGKFVLPASTDFNSQKNQIDYSATLTGDQNGDALAYEFSLTNKAGIDFNALFMNVALDNTSRIDIKGSTSQPFRASARLDGKLSIVGSQDIKIPGAGKVDLPGITFKNLKFMTDGDFIDKDGLIISFASPAKKMAGFEYNLESSGIDVSPDGLGVNVAVNFNGEIKISESAMACAAKAKFSLNSGIKKNNQGRIVWTGIGGKLNDITFAAGADLGAFKIKGAIKYFNRTEGNNIDEGFIGALETNIAGMVTVNMRAQFGSKSTGGDSFKYLNFSALVDFGQAGITFAPPAPLAIYGFGGGFYYNMALDTSSVPKANKIPVKEKTSNTVSSTYTSENDPDPAAGAEALLTNDPAGLKLTPQLGGKGLQATVLFGLTSRNTLDADATFSIGFTEDGGFDYIRLDGYARILTNVSKPLSERRGVSTGAGELHIVYNHPEQSFKVQIGAQLGVPNVDHHELLFIDGHAEFESNPNGWYIHVGRPRGIGTGPNTVSVFNGLFTGDSYFEVGTMEIDPMPQIPADVIQLAGGNLQRSPAAPRAFKAESNQGLIFGASQKFGFKDAQFLMFFGTLQAKMGFDLSIKPNISCLGVSAAGGPDGWYAKGSAYMGAQATIGIKVNFLFIKGTFTIFDAGAGAIIQAGLPNPAWAEGSVGGYFSIMDGAIAANFNFRFAVGQKCVSGTDALGGLQIISQLTPVTQTDEKVNLNVVPAVAFNMRLGGDYDQGGGYVGGYFEFEDYEHADEYGNAKVRKFLFDRSCVKILLNGQEISGNMRRLDEFSLAYNTSDHLAKNTKYTFRVEAKMKEEFGKSGNYNYKFVQENNQDVVEPKEITFTTDEGFSSIHSTEYARTVPMHSHKDIPVQQFGAMDGKMVIETKKVIHNEAYFLYPEGTVYTARVYRNGQRVGGDQPVAMEVANNYLNDGVYRPATNSSGQLVHYDNSHSRWSFAGPQLVKNSDYKVFIIAKVPGGSTADTSTFKVGNTSISGGRVGGNLVSGGNLLRRTTQLGTINKLGANENIAASFAFSTSNYNTYQDKFDDLAIVKIANLDYPTAYMSTARNAGQNLAFFTSTVPRVNGIYKVQLGKGCNFGVEITLNGERLSVADIEGAKSNTIFQPDYSKGGNTANISTPRLFPFNPYAGFATYSKDNYAKLKAFISACTSIPVSSLQVTFTQAGEESDGWMSCFNTGGTSSELTDNYSSIGAPVPDALPQSAQNAGVMANGFGFAVPGLAIGSTVAIAKETGQIWGCKDRGQVTFTNEIQKQIDKMTQWGVNWGYNTGNMANPAPVFNQTSTWESIGAVTTNIINGKVSKPQLPAAMKNSFR